MYTQKTIAEPHSKSEAAYAAKQESIRKDVERAFGILQARFAIVRMPSRLWSVEDMGMIMKCCIILHNMVVEDERHSYKLNNLITARQAWSEYEQHEAAQWTDPATEASFKSLNGVDSEEPVSPLTRMMKSFCSLSSSLTHVSLRDDLVKHIWNFISEDKDVQSDEEI